MGLNTVFNEVVVASDSVTNVVLDCEKVHSVDGDYSCEGFMDCVSSNKGSGHLFGHVEMDAVSTKDLRLAALSELRIGDMSFQSIRISSSKHQVRTIFGDN